MITEDPVSRTVVVGESESLTVTVNSTLPVKYQWYFNGAPVDGATNASFTVEEAVYADSGTYIVQVENDEGSSFSEGAVLNVIPAINDEVGGFLIGTQQTSTFQVSDYDGELLEGSRFLAQVYAGFSTNTLVPAGPAVPFLVGDKAGHFAPFALYMPGIAPGEEIVLQLHVWDRISGRTYEETVSTLGQRGKSDLVSALSGGETTPLTEVSFPGFTLVMPPHIKVHPQSRTTLAGQEVVFQVEAVGSQPMSYVWRFLGEQIEGATSSSLVLTDVQMDSMGDYTVEVSNGYGEAFSEAATLVVDAPPVIAITSPETGTTFDSRITLSGQIIDIIGLSKAQWFHNGALRGDLVVQDGQFTVPDIILARGDNLFKVEAHDISGNVATETVSLSFRASHTFEVGEIAPVREGQHVYVPIILTTRGGVGAFTLSLGYNQSLFADADLIWENVPNNSFKQVHVGASGSGVIKASLALSGTSLPAGTQHVATAVLRTRSLPQAITTGFYISLDGVFGTGGDPLPAETTEVKSGTVQILQREFKGDCNGNGKLDINDAAHIMRMVNRVELPRYWDVPANDLNGNNQLDTGDIVRVLRAVVGLDPQPANTAEALGVTSAEGNGQVDIEVLHESWEPGEQVLVRVRLLNVQIPVSGASLRFRYPVTALRLDGMEAHREGEIVPSNSIRLWNVAPGQDDYAVQNGTVSLAVSSDSNWPTSSGVIAELTFTIQDGVFDQFSWPIEVLEAELSSGYSLVELGSAVTEIRVREPFPAEFVGEPVLTSEGVSFSLIGEAGVTYLIEVSEDLVAWSEFMTLSSNGEQVRFSDEHRSHSHRFYRARMIE